MSENPPSYMIMTDGDNVPSSIIMRDSYLASQQHSDTTMNLKGIPPHQLPNMAMNLKGIPQQLPNMAMNLKGVPQQLPNMSMNLKGVPQQLPNMAMNLKGIPQQLPSAAMMMAVAGNTMAINEPVNLSDCMMQHQQQQQQHQQPVNNLENGVQNYAIKMTESDQLELEDNQAVDLMMNQQNVSSHDEMQMDDSQHEVANPADFLEMKGTEGEGEEEELLQPKEEKAGPELRMRAEKDEYLLQICKEEARNFTIATSVKKKRGRKKKRWGVTKRRFIQARNIDSMDYPVGSPLPNMNDKLTREMRNEIREQIIELRTEGWLIRDIAYKLGISKTTVKKWIVRYNDTGTVDTGYKTTDKQIGRRRITSKEEDDLIFNFICGLQVDEEKLSTINICYETLRRRIQERYEQIMENNEFFPHEHKSAVEEFLFNKTGTSHPILEKVTKEDFRCTVCNKPFKRNYARLEHELTHTDIREHLCLLCGKKFRTARNLKIHERLHTGEKPYQCRFCERKFVDLANCYKHIHRRHKDLHEECKRNNVKSVLVFKKEEDIQKKKTKVKRQGDGVSSQGSLVNRLGEKNNKNKLSHEIKDRIRKRIILLSEEGYTMRAIASRLNIAKGTVKRWLVRYKETGGVETIHKSTKENIGRRRVTSNEQDDLIFDYICGLPVDESKLADISICYATLRRRVQEKYEKMVQNGDFFPDQHKSAVQDFLFNKTGTQHPLLQKVTKSDYRCTVCNKSFKRNSARLEHENVHNTVREFPCRFCEKKFKTPRNVKIHERLHTGEKPYQCRWCERKFVDLANCYKHIGRIHKSLHEEAKRNKEKSVIVLKDSGLNADDLLKTLTENNQIPLPPPKPEVNKPRKKYSPIKTPSAKKEPKTNEFIELVSVSPNPINMHSPTPVTLTNNYMTAPATNYMPPFSHLQHPFSHMQPPHAYEMKPPISHMQIPTSHSTSHMQQPPPSHMQPAHTSHSHLAHMQSLSPHLQPPPSHMQPVNMQHMPLHMQQHQEQQVPISHSVFGGYSA